MSYTLSPSEAFYGQLEKVKIKTVKAEWLTVALQF